MKHLSSGLRVGLAMVFCTALLAPSALADNGKKPEDGPGNSANAPGHNKDADAAPPQAGGPETRPPETRSPEPPPPSAPAEDKPAPSEGPTAEAKHQEPPPPAVAPPAAKAVDRERPEKPKKAETNPRPVGGGGPSKSSSEASAHRKVLICHATGSATNPYVLISVSVNAWTGGHGHAGHADDVFVDWSWPGDPRQKNDALCPASGPVGPPTTSTTTTVASTTAPSSSTPEDTGPRAGTAIAEPSAADKPPRKELHPSLAPPEQAVEYAVLATSGLAGTAVRGTLPFTGLPVWVAALFGLSLLSVGLVLRRRTAAAS